jgi:hypothetical protein
VGHEYLRELSVALIYDTGKHFIELGHVRLDQLQLVVTLPEGCNLDFQVDQRLLRIFVGDVFPELFFENGIRKALIAMLLDGLASIGFVSFEAFKPQVFLFVKREVGGCTVALHDSILVLVGHLTIEFLSINSNLSSVNPICSHFEMLHGSHEDHSFVNTEHLHFLVSFFILGFLEEEGGDLKVEF